MRTRHLKVCSFPQMGIVLAIALGVVFAGIQANAADLIWDNGSGDSLWNTTSTNWSGTATWSNSVPDNATFTATGAGAVTLGEAITAGTVNITAGAYTFSQSGGSLSFTTLNSTGSDQVFFNGGVLTGTGTINNTTGRLVVYGNNSSYSGTINHLSGAENLYVDNANSLGTGTLNLFGGFLTCDNSPTLNSVLTINATGGRLGGNGVDDELRIAGTLNLNSGGSGVTFNNSINNRTLRFKSGATIGGDAASVTVGRSTTFIESGVDITYAGSFVITRTSPGASVLNLGNGIDLSSSGSNNTIIFSDGGVNNQPRMVQVSAGGASAIIGNVAQNETTEGLAVLSAGADSTLTVAGVMSGRDISIQGGGTVIMTGNNTYVGQTSIQEGTLKLEETGSLACNLVTVNSGATFDVYDGYFAASGKTISGAGTLRASGDIGFETGSVVTINTLQVTGGTTSNLTDTAISRLEVSGGTAVLDDSMDLSEIRLPAGSTGVVSVAAAGVSTDTLTLYGDGALRASDYVLTINAGGSISDYSNYVVIDADSVNGLTLQGSNLTSTAEARTLTLGGGTATITALANINESYALNYDAGVDTDGNGAWESTTALQTLNWALGANIARTTTLSGAPSGITAAYDFPTSGSNNDADKAAAGTFNGPVAVNVDSTWEFWVQADDLSTDQTLWESGGSADGSGLMIKSDGTILFIAKNGGASAVVTNMFPTDGSFHQVMVTLDMDAVGTTDILKMYIDGTLVDTDDSQTGVDNWAGGDGSGLGGYGGGDTGGTTGAAGDINYGTFDGRFAIMRFYEGTALSDSQVLANYQAVKAPGINLESTDIHIDADSTINLNGAGNAVFGDLSFESSSVTLTVTNDTYDAVSDLVQQWGSQSGIGCTEYNTGGDSYAVFRKLLGGTIILVN